MSLRGLAASLRGLAVSLWVVGEFLSFFIVGILFSPHTLVAQSSESGTCEIVASSLVRGRRDANLETLKW